MITESLIVSKGKNYDPEIVTSLNFEQLGLYRH